MLENITLLSLLATVIILTVLAHVYFYFYLKTLRRQLDSQTYQLYFAATGKADLLPLAIERLKVHDPSYSFAGLIEAGEADGCLTLCAPTRFHATYIQTHLLDRLRVAVQRSDGRLGKVRVLAP